MDKVFDNAFANEIVFVRKFRWIFGSSHLPSAFMKKVDFDFVARKINFSYYEIGEANLKESRISTWLKYDLSKEELTFISYDGCGQPIYKLIFRDLELTSDKVDFDYDSNAESNRNISLIYKTLKRIEDEKLLAEQEKE